MYIITNTLLSLLIIGFIFYGKHTGADGYQILAVSVLFYMIMGNAIFLASRRRVKRGESMVPEYVLFVLMVFLGNSMIYWMGSTLCTIECFGIDIVFFDILLLIVASILFGLRVFFTTDRKQRIICGCIMFVLLGMFSYDPLSHWYKETYVITRFPNSRTYYKDTKNVYCGFFTRTRIEGAYVDSFVAIDGIYAKDKENIYYLCSFLTKADPKTFEILKGGTYDTHIDMIAPNGSTEGNYVDVSYARDKNSVFFLDKVVPGANPKTFEVLGNGYARDGATYYFEGVETSKDNVKLHNPANTN